MSTRLFWFIFTVIVIVAVAIRFYNLGQVPVALYWDEVAMYVDARSVAETGKDMHSRPWFQILYPSYGDYKQPVYIWFAALSFKLFGASEWALRLPSALAGVGSVIVGGMLARNLSKLITRNSKLKVSLSEKTQSWVIQLATMTILAISPWSLLFSRTAFEGHVGQFLLASSILILSYQKKSFLFLFSSVFLASIATYAYFSVRFVWPIIFVLYQLTVSHLPLVKNLWLKTCVVSVVIPLVLYGLLLIPMFSSPFYAASNQFRLSTASIFNSHEYALQSNTYREMAGNTVIDRIFFHRHVLLLKELADNYADIFSVRFLFLTGDPNLRHGTGVHGLFLLSFLPFFLLGLYHLCETSKRQLFFLSIWILLAALPASVPEDTPHALRFLNALVPLSLVIGIGCAFFLEKIKTFSRASHSVVLSIAIVTVLLNISHLLHYYSIIYPAASADSWLGGYKEVAINYFKNEERVDEFYWELADDKFYLWLLAYGNLTSSEIQELETNSFLVTTDQFEKYQQEIFPGWSAVGGNVKRIIVATEPDRVIHFQNDNNTIIKDLQYVGYANLALLELERKND